MKSDKGFSLLELMVAIAVLAVIAAAVFHRNSAALDQQRLLETQTIAQWVGQTKLEELKYRSRIEEIDVASSGAFSTIQVGTYEFDLRTDFVPIDDFNAQWVVVDIYHTNGPSPDQRIQTVKAVVPLR